MIKVSYNEQLNTLIIEFIGEVDVLQGEQYLPEIAKSIPKNTKGFTLLVDLT